MIGETADDEPACTRVTLSYPIRKIIRLATRAREQHVTQWCRHRVEQCLRVVEYSLVEIARMRIENRRLRR